MQSFKKRVYNCNGQISILSIFLQFKLTSFQEKTVFEKKNSAETALHVFNITGDARGSQGIQAGWAVVENGGPIPKVPVCLRWAPQHLT